MTSKAKDLLYPVTFADHLAQLRPRAATFVREVVAGMIPTKAARYAGYAPASAHVRASRLIRQPAVRAAITAGFAEERQRNAVRAADIAARLREKRTAAGGGRMSPLMQRIYANLAIDDARRSARTARRSISPNDSTPTKP